MHDDTDTETGKAPAGAWRDVIKVHPAADLFPLITPDELRALGEDIKAHGLRENVATWAAEEGGERLLLDGRNRLDAMELVGLPYDIGVDAVSYGSEIDPYAYVLSANMRRRHLTPKQRREIIAKVIKAQPEKSNRQIAKQTKADDKTVASVRRKLEARSDVPNVATTTDTMGRRQPTRKARRTVEDFLGEKNAPGKAVADCAKQADIEHALPDADRLVQKIMERDRIAPGYTVAVLQGLVDAIGGPHRVPGVYQVAHALLCAFAKKAGDDTAYRKLRDGEGISQSFVGVVVDDVEARLKNATATADDLDIPAFLRRLPS